MSQNPLNNQDRKADPDALNRVPEQKDALINQDELLGDDSGKYRLRLSKNRYRGRGGQFSYLRFDKDTMTIVEMESADIDEEEE